MKLTIYRSQTIDQTLDEDKEFSIFFDRMAVRRVEKDKADDSLHYKAENLGKVKIVQGDKVIEAKQKDWFPQKLRGASFFIFDQYGLTEDFEEWREKFKKKIIAYLPEIYELIKNKS